MEHDSILIRNGWIVTMNPEREILRGNLYLENGRIKELPSVRQTADIVIDADGMLVLPGFVQTHLHLCQVLFRGLADDMDVVDWLKQRIWPFESSHNDCSIYASAMLGIAELIASGTTTALTMESALHTDAVFDAIEQTGFRAVTGNAMMDVVEPGTMMRALNTDESFLETQRLFHTWHGRANGRIHVAVMPRGARNCSDDLIARSRRFAEDNGLLLHTHVSENGWLSEHLKKTTGLSDMELLEQQHMACSRLVIAHGVWLSDHDAEIIKRRGVRIAHCPSANLKLASGFCQVPELRAQGILFGLGADGAPCSNTLDMFVEMREAALIHKPRCGPKALPASDILSLATIDGARCLHMENEIGSLEPGKRADVIILDPHQLHCSPSLCTPVESQIVYAMHAGDVVTTIIDGQILYRDRTFTRFHRDQLLRTAEQELEQALHRVPFGPHLLENSLQRRMKTCD